MPNREPSFAELRALFYCWKLREPLSCEGYTWSFRKQPTFGILRPVIDSMVEQGWIRRINRYDNEAHDSYRITYEGMAVIRDREMEYYEQVERRVDEKIGWDKQHWQRDAIKVAVPVEVALPNQAGVWRRQTLRYGLVRSSPLGHESKGGNP
jgi:hypothetical protein